MTEYKNPQRAIKINLFGYLTPFGIGDLFLFSNYTYQTKFINYLHYEVIPSIKEIFGDRFVLVLDNSSIHKAKMCLEFYHRVKLNVLIWAPQTPEWDVIKNVWAILSKRVNQSVFGHGPVNRRADLTKLAFDMWYGIEKRIIVVIRKVQISRSECRTRAHAASHSRLFTFAKIHCHSLCKTTGNCHPLLTAVIWFSPGMSNRSAYLATVIL